MEGAYGRGVDVQSIEEYDERVQRFSGRIFRVPEIVFKTGGSISNPRHPDIISASWHVPGV